MSNYIASKQAGQPVSSEDLRNYFQSFSKPVGSHAIGLEWELFGVDPETGAPKPYYGTQGIEAVLKRLSDKFGYKPVEEKGRVIALSREDDSVGLEPGGQLEFSPKAVRTVHGIKAQIDLFRRELAEISPEFWIAWLGTGFHPFASLDELEWVPKARYEIMKNFLKARGALAHDMMKRTAAVQVSVDFEGEADALEKLRVIFGVTSLVSALFSNSPVTEGKPNGFLNYRMRAWRHTDARRTGFVPALFRKNAGFSDYLDYALDVPVMFVVRDGRWVPLPGISFREYLDKGFGGLRATRDDFELHVRTLFPEARLKNCIEIRGADGQHFEHVPAVAALWKGLLYSKSAREEAWGLVKDLSMGERQSFHAGMEEKGPNFFLGRARGWDLEKELFAIARRGLKAEPELGPGGDDEAVYLEDFYEKFVLTEKTPAEVLLEKWIGEFRRKPAKLVGYLKI